MSWLHYPGVILGLLGALLVAQSSARFVRAGFALWMGSNVCLIIWASGLDDGWPMVGMFAFYFVTSALGWWNHRPRWVAMTLREVRCPICGELVTSDQAIQMRRGVVYHAGCVRHDVQVAG
jgi:hypothetical protein